MICYCFFLSIPILFDLSPVWFLFRTKIKKISVHVLEFIYSRDDDDDDNDPICLNSVVKVDFFPSIRKKSTSEKFFTIFFFFCFLSS